MKKRYYIPVLALLLLAALTYYYAYGYAFASGVLAAIAALWALFGLFDALKKRYPRTAKYARRTLLLALCAVLLLTAATGIWVGVAMAGAENPQANYVIVLGAGVNGSVPSRSLRERLDAALEYLQRYPDAIAVLSGGQGAYEHITEAQCMYDWLLARGIDGSRLRKEERATSTQENIAFSLALIEAETGKKPERVAVLSSEYHLRRAMLYAEKEGVTALGYPARTQSVFTRVHYFVREICGIWASVFA
ncbi:MAG: YdcF family protein [Oscillospiraceae bacterium]|jgi:uncharacterized SAM-binding protein YcdF (DUF218 family)|nr:YdcF family protein [Oscillospiraceae bacterium]